MNYDKLDASLSAVLSDASTSDELLNVSIRTQEPPNEDQQREMERLGVYGVSGKSRIFSAQLSPQAVSELSEKSWIRLLSLSQRMRPLV